MSDLVTFLEARLAEDEATVSEIHQPRVCGSVDRDGEFDPDPIWCSCGYPARVLREVEADRALLAKLRQVEELGERLRVDTEILILRQVIAIRAAIWSDHPDYRGWLQ